MHNTVHRVYTPKQWMNEMKEKERKRTRTVIIINS